MVRFTADPGTGVIDHCNGSVQNRSERCRHDANCITAYGFAALKAFREANPGVSFAHESNPCFAIISQRRLPHHRPCASYGGYMGGIIDHEGAARVRDALPVYIPQPYHTAHDKSFDGRSLVEHLGRNIASNPCTRKRLSGLTLVIRYAGAGRSWYNPGTTALWLIGTPEATNTINADYPPPPLPSTMTEGPKDTFVPSAADFDAPLALPEWTLHVPDFNCRFVKQNGQFCGQATEPEHELCTKHNSFRFTKQ